MIGFSEVDLSLNPLGFDSKCPNNPKMTNFIFELAFEH